MILYNIATFCIWKMKVTTSLNKTEINIIKHFLSCYLWISIHGEIKHRQSPSYYHAKTL